MATQRQIEANRRNAQKSTGPRTDAGRAAIRNNAHKHGLAAALPHECLAEVADLRASLIESCQPANDLELIAVEVIAESYLRMQRASRFEAEFFASEIENFKADLDIPTVPDAANDDAHAAAILTAERHEHAVKMIDRYSQRATSKYFKAVDQLRKMQAERRRLEAAEQQRQTTAAKLASFRYLTEEPEKAIAAAAGAAPAAQQAAPILPPALPDPEAIAGNSTATQSALSGANVIAIGNHPEPGRQPQQTATVLNRRTSELSVFEAPILPISKV